MTGGTFNTDFAIFGFFVVMVFMVAALIVQYYEERN